MTDARLVRLVEKGVLELVVWESTVECGKGARLKCWQPVLYSHAILAAWGTRPNLYYSFADHDEYLAMPYPDHIGSVQDIITMCSDGQTQVRAGLRSGLPWPSTVYAQLQNQEASGVHSFGRPAACGFWRNNLRAPGLLWPNMLLSLALLVRSPGCF